MHQSIRQIVDRIYYWKFFSVYPNDDDVLDVWVSGKYWAISTVEAPLENEWNDWLFGVVWIVFKIFKADKCDCGCAWLSVTIEYSAPSAKIERKMHFTMYVYIYIRI